MSPLIIAAIVVVIIVAAYFLTRPKSATHPPISPPLPPPPAPMWSATPTATGSWDPNGMGAYTCDGTLQPGWCIVPDPQTAQTVCAKDPACTGYYTTGDTGWPAAVGSPTAAQLTNSASQLANAGPQPSAYYAKPAGM